MNRLWWSGLAYIKIKIDRYSRDPGTKTVNYVYRNEESKLYILEKQFETIYISTAYI